MLFRYAPLRCPEERAIFAYAAICYGYAATLSMIAYADIATYDIVIIQHFRQFAMFHY